MTDFITVLTHGSFRLAKKWMPDGEVLSYEQAEKMKMQVPAVTDLRHLSRILTKIEQNVRTAVIRGEYRGDAVRDALYSPEVLPKGQYFKRKVLFADCAHHWVMFDVDGFAPLCCDPWIDPVGAIHEYITAHLPVAFHDTSFHWQLSNTHGHPKNKGLLKVHLWFWCENTYTSAQWKAWQARDAIEVDYKPFDQTQWHYTARPVMHKDMVDPVAVRSGFFDGLMGDVVPFDIGLLDIPAERMAGGVEGIDPGDCPVGQFLEERCMVLESDGRSLFLGDEGGPRGHLHTTNTGASSVAWLLPGTGDHVHGHFACRHGSCQTEGPITNQEFFDHIGYTYPADELVALPAIPKEKELPSFADRTDKGSIKATIEQVVVALKSEMFLGIQIGYDSFKDELCISHNGNWKPFADQDYTQLRIMLATRGFLPVGKEMVKDAVLLVARNNQFDSAQLWLDSLKWDGVPRVDSFFRKYFCTEDSEYTTLVGRYMWSALAGRIIEPGVKADMVPILEGEQGVRKSSAVEALVPIPALFTEIALDEKEDNISRKIRGVLVAEIPELDGLHTKRVEGIKAFITKRVEKWVPKYLEFETRMARRVLFIGTTNSDELLADESGNRRWLPMHVECADVPGIVAVRDQLWAEGAHLFRTRGVCWQKLDVLALPAHSKYSSNDPWTDPINTWLHSQEMFNDGKVVKNNGECPFTTAMLLSGALHISVEAHSITVSKRVGAILRKLGFKRGTVRINGHSCDGWKSKTAVSCGV